MSKTLLSRLYSFRLDFTALDMHHSRNYFLLFLVGSYAEVMTVPQKQCRLNGPHKGDPVAVVQPSQFSWLSQWPVS